MWTILYQRQMPWTVRVGVQDMSSSNYTLALATTTVSALMLKEIITPKEAVLIGVIALPVAMLYNLFDDLLDLWHSRKSLDRR